MLPTNTNIKLTIALQTHNRVQHGYLQAMLESILNQTYRDYELFVMDNHSTDGTMELVTSYDDPRITYIRQPPGGNATTNTNRAVWMARGEYVLATHDDDIMESTMVEKMMAYFQAHPETICLSTNVSLIDWEGQKLQNQLYSGTSDRKFEIGSYIETYLKEKFWFPTPTLMYKRDAYVATQPKNVRMLNPAYFPSGDIWSVFMFNLRGPVAFLAEPLLQYRQHSQQESRNVHQSEPMLQLMTMLMKRKANHPVVKQYLPIIQATLSKYKLQDALFKNSSRKNFLQLRREIEKIYSQSNHGVEKEPSEMVLPLYIMLRLLSSQRVGTGPSGKSGSTNSSLQAYAIWDEILSRGDSLLEEFKGKRIAVFGSMLTAYLIVRDAHISGAEFMGIYDSSPARIGQYVFQHQIHSIESVNLIQDNCDAVILTSERDHEQAIVEILKGYLGNDGPHVRSWKDIAFSTQKNNQNASSTEGYTKDLVYE